MSFVPQALAGDPEDGPESEDDSALDEVEIGIEQVPAIYGGAATNYCGWPTAVYLSIGNSACSGTLVHPDIVITAAHCPDSVNGANVTVSFGEGFGGGERNISATCYSNPSWNGQVGPDDYGYCRLSQSVTDVPIVPPAYGCEVDALTPGREVVIVGFGNSDNGGSGSKREVTTTIQGINTEALIGGGGADACQGDSGGPVYVKLASQFGGDDTWRSFGITSGGAACGQGGIFALMHIAIPWIESHSGVDITPCHNSQGDWQPGPDCGYIPLDPANSQGSWANGCSTGPISGVSALCGAPFGSGEDEDPPTVNIISPSNGTVYPTNGGTADVGIAVTADDGDGFGVAEVRLLIDGADFSGNIDTTEPYTWDLVFPPGGYLIEAIATDYNGNESTPDSTAIGVDEDAPESGDGGSDSGSDGSGGDEDSGDSGSSAEGGGIPGSGFGGEGGTAEIGCACTAGAAGGASGRGAGGLLLLGLFGCLGLRRGSRRERPTR